MDFEFDDMKNERNILKHKLGFNEIVPIFEDPYFLAIPARRRGERRMLGLGALDDRVVAVIYTLREEKIRLISARWATAQERKFYDGKKK